VYRSTRVPHPTKIQGYYTPSKNFKGYLYPFLNNRGVTHSFYTEYSVLFYTEYSVLFYTEYSVLFLLFICCLFGRVCRLHVAFTLISYYFCDWFLRTYTLSQRWSCVFVPFETDSNAWFHGSMRDSRKILRDVEPWSTIKETSTPLKRPLTRTHTNHCLDNESHVQQVHSLLHNNLIFDFNFSSV